MLQTRFDFAISIIKEAQNILKANSTGSPEKIEKEKYNYVTSMDLTINEFLTKTISARYPDSKIISEEMPVNEFDLSDTWIIDPLDGTTNYLHHYPHFAISLAYFSEGTAQFSIILDPVIDEWFIAQLGRGAFLNGRRIKVSEEAALENSLIGFGLPYDRQKGAFVLECAQKIYPHCQDLKRKGPASIDLAYVAAGRLDAYFEPDLKIWDIAAGILLIKEARGQVADWSGNVFNIGMEQNILAGNKKIIKAIAGFLER
ncbi:inositol monophosphatase family protein [Bacillus sp. EB01]|uniref:inositol monophosphatase family protein n=1 Tax=Bacillus sp. EB01 TaxID=1347086 RepID=UPI0005C73DB9|nr:inositol monophosphatase family protein [Bacillus sp. EB01]